MQSSDRIGPELLKMLGIGTDDVHAAQIEIRGGKPIKVTLEISVIKAKGAGIGTTEYFKEYELVRTK